jgi:tetratricopeptide (TPR) repeat protein
MRRLKDLPKLISYLIWRWRTIGHIEKLWTSKDYTELIGQCDLMQSKNPKDYLAFYYRGLSYEALGLFDDSIRDFMQSELTLINYKNESSVKEYFSKIPIQISRVYRKMQDKEKAFEYADKSVQADNTDVEGLKYRALLKADFEDNIGALEDLNEALKRRPGDKLILKLRNQLTYDVIQDHRETASR